MNDVKTDWDIETFVMPNELVFSSCLYRKLSKSRVLSGEFKMSMKLKTGGMYDYDVCVCVCILCWFYIRLSVHLENVAKMYFQSILVSKRNAAFLCAPQCDGKNRCLHGFFFLLYLLNTHPFGLHSFINS